MEKEYDGPERDIEIATSAQRSYVKLWTLKRGLTIRQGTGAHYKQNQQGEHSDGCLKVSRHNG